MIGIFDTVEAGNIDHFLKIYITNLPLYDLLNWNGLYYKFVYLMVFYAIEIADFVTKSSFQKLEKVLWNLNEGAKNPEFFFDICHIYGTGLDQNFFQIKNGVRKSQKGFVNIWTPNYDNLLWKKIIKVLWEFFERKKIFRQKVDEVISFDCTVKPSNTDSME
jgi:hypothetical protein